MSYTSVDIKSLPLADEVKDSDLVILEKNNFTAAAPAGLFKDYLINELSNIVSANTYTADGITLNLSGGEFKVADGGIDENQLSPAVLLKLNSGGGGTSSSGAFGSIKTYTNPITSNEEYLEIYINPSGGGPIETYAIRVYKVS